MQKVTLVVGGTVAGAPVLVGRADIGAGAVAKVLGGVTLGAHCMASSNAMVLQDLPDGATAVGSGANCSGTPAVNSADKEGIGT